jgi:hypothetical protein
MAGQPKIIIPSTSPENVAATKIVTPAEQAFARLKATGKLRNWFHARHGLDGDGWTCMVSGLQAALAPAVGAAAAQVNPTINTTGGPNNVPYALGKSSDPAGIMLTPNGTTVLSWASDFTICAVAKAGTSAAANLCGIVGDNGAALGIGLRSSNLISASTFVGSTGTHRWSATGFALSSTQWHNVEIVWTGNAAAGILSVYANGTLLGASASFTPPTQLTTRLAILGAFDLQLDLARQGRALSLAHLAVCPTSFVTDTATRNIWRAMVLDQCGILPV